LLTGIVASLLVSRQTAAQAPETIVEVERRSLTSSNCFVPHEATRLAVGEREVRRC
jgi:hypothetical protein